MKRRMLLGSIGNYPINIIIGGVASIINTKSALATKLDIAESDVRRFEIFGSDIRANIRKQYSVLSGAFQNNKMITSFIDLGNLCIDFQINAFNGATNLRSVKANAVTWLKNSCLRNCPMDLLFEMFGVVQSNQYSLYGSKIKTYNISPLFAAANGYVFHSNTDVEHLNLPSLTALAREQDIWNLSSLKTLTLPSLETRNESSVNFLCGLTSCELISMRKFKSFLNNSVSNFSFVDLKLGCTIEVHINCLTANNGNPMAQLLWAKNNRSAIVKFYDDNGNYVSTL